MQALYSCMRRQGYAGTTLRDIAKRAGMTPSHVAYYFENQAAILEYYAESICEQNLRALPDLEEEDVERLLDQIAAFCFEETRTSPGLLGVIQELTGLAVHDERLHEIKARHTRGWRSYLEAVFARACADRMSPREAALQAHALLVGLNTNAVFDDVLDRATAHSLFRCELRDLAGLEPASRSRSRSPRAAARRRATRKDLR